MNDNDPTADDKEPSVAHAAWATTSYDPMRAANRGVALANESFYGETARMHVEEARAKRVAVKPQP